MLKNGKSLFPAVMILCAFLLFGASGTIYAKSIVTVTRPTDGSTVTPGKVSVYTTFTYTGGSIGEFVAKISPMVVQVLDSSGKIIETEKWQASTGTLELIDKYRLDVNLPSEGTYTIRAKVPGSPDEWSSVTVTAKNKTDTDTQEEETNPGQDDSEWPEGTWWWTIIPNSENPGYYISVDKTEYKIDLKGKNYVRIKFTMSVDKTLYESDHNKGQYYYYSSDRVTKAGEKIVKFKDIGDKIFKLKGDKYVCETWLEYKGVKAGATKMQIFFLANGKWYDKHEITLYVVAPNTMTAKGKTVSLKEKTLAKKNQTIDAKKAFTIKKAIGAVSYKKVKGNQKILVAGKTGKITVKKGLKKGTYDLVVKVTASGNNLYKKLSKNVTVKIKMK